MGTHVLKLTDGTTTIELASGNQYLIEYMPMAPDLSTVDFTPESMLDGGERPVTTRRNVTEGAKVMFKDTTTDAIRATIRSVEALFRQAERQQTFQQTVPVYVQFQPGSAGTVYQSEVLSGKVELQDALSAGAWGGKQIEVQLTWTRRYYWAETTLTAIPLSNSASSNVTTGLKVYNHNDSDAGHDNYVSIASSVITGSIPAPVDFTFCNGADANAEKLFTLYVGSNVFGSPSTWVNYWEGEAMTQITGTTNLLDLDAKYSDAKANIFNFTNTGVIGYTLDANKRSYGNWVRLIGRMNAVVSGSPNAIVKLQASLVYTESGYGTKTLWTGQVIKSSSPWQFHDFGTFMLPPWLNVRGVKSQDLSLRVTSTYAGSAALYVDWMMLLPMDSSRLYGHKLGLGMGWSLRDFVQYEKNLIVFDSSAGTPPFQTGYRTAANMSAIGGVQFVGSQLMVWPSLEHKFYFAWAAYPTSGTGNVMTADHYGTVWMHYAPRRLTF